MKINSEILGGFSKCRPTTELAVQGWTTLFLSRPTRFSANIFVDLVVFFVTSDISSVSRKEDKVVSTTGLSLVQRSPTD